MKKVLALLLAALMLLSCTLFFASCNGGDADGNQNDDTTVAENPTDESQPDKESTEDAGDDTTAGEDIPSQPDDDRQKLSGKIIAGSTYSEGLAFVEVDGVEGKTFCIDKDGYIVFTLDMTLPHVFLGEIITCFNKGFACVHADSDNYIVDTKGTVTRPADVGATVFYGEALGEGYILATKEEVTFNSSKKMLGVMDTAFNWVVEPTEELYASVCEGTVIGSWYNSDYFSCREGYLRYTTESNDVLYLELATGEISSNPELKDFVYEEEFIGDAIRNKHGDTVCNYEVDYNTLTAVVTFYNENKIFMTVLDKELNFLYDPVVVVDQTYSSFLDIVYDGEYVLLEVRDSSNKKILKTFDAQGNALGTLNPKSLGENVAYSHRFMDGVLWLQGAYNGYIRSMGYYGADLNPLFE